MHGSLELASEKITMLKEKLDHVTAEKENDFKIFEKIINNSKTHILESILAQRAANETSSETKTN